MIAGTGDDCIGDICGVAGGFNGLYPSVKLTVFGLAMNEQAAANYTCAAKAMGGSFTPSSPGPNSTRTCGKSWAFHKPRRKRRPLSRNLPRRRRRPRPPEGRDGESAAASEKARPPSQARPLRRSSRARRRPKRPAPGAANRIQCRPFGRSHAGAPPLDAGRDLGDLQSPDDADRTDAPRGSSSVDWRRRTGEGEAARGPLQRRADLRLRHGERGVRRRRRRARSKKP